MKGRLEREQSKYIEVPIHSGGNAFVVYTNA
jgi:hypothetical protein